MRRHGIWLGVSIALACVSVAAGSSSDPGPPADPQCRIVARHAGESHGIHYSTSCNFAQISVKVSSRRLMYGFRPVPTLRGPVDDGDGFRCPPFAEKPDHAATCHGRAGAGVRVGLYLVTRHDQCRVATTVEVTGTADCPVNLACPAIAYAVSKRIESPSGCGAT